MNKKGSELNRNSFLLESSFFNNHGKKRTFTEKLFIFILKFLFTVLFLVLIFRSIDIQHFLEKVRSPLVFPLILMAILSILYVFLNGFKMWLILNAYQPISMWLFIRHFFISGSISSLVPSIFGDAALVALLKKSSFPIQVSIIIIVADRLLSLSLIFFIFLPATFSYIYGINAVFTFFVSLACGLGCYFLLRVIDDLYISSRLNKFTKTIKACFDFFINNKNIFYYSIFTNFIKCIVSGLALIFALIAAGLHPDVLSSICFTNSLSFFTHVPITFSGLGLYEGSGIILFETMELNREKLVAGFFYHRLYIILWAAVVLLTLPMISFREANDPNV